MAARLWTALLVLAAVFAMHGVQCTTAADSAAHAATPAGHAADAVSLAMTVLTPGHATATAGLTLGDPIAAVPIAGHADSGPATLAGAPAMAAAGHGGAPHDAAAHLWLGGVSVEGSLTSSSQDAPMVVTVIWTGPRPCRSALDASSS